MADGVVDIRGKKYQTVGLRVQKFRGQYPLYTIATEVISADDERVVMKATIADGDLVIATGFAEEVRSSSNINKTSAMENCETSAVGRALAFFGLAGTEIASADEVAGAISQQNEKELYSQAAEHMDAVHEHWASLIEIRQFLADDNLSAALEAWREIGEDDMRKLWKAPSKGGFFRTKERSLLDQAATEFSRERNKK